MIIHATSERELKAALVNISLDNPGKAVLVHVSFGTCRIFIYPSVSRIPIDTPATRQMLSTYGGIAFVNGKLAQPSKGWRHRQHLADMRTHQG